jgi:2-polyprenyl-6-methoxyphenol hydroxylase-like FAD-dependent oxidoreductase
VSRPPGILLAGAGPAGLALALQTHDHGADVRILGRRSGGYRSTYASATPRLVPADEGYPAAGGPDR